MSTESLSYSLSCMLWKSLCDIRQCLAYPVSCAFIVLSSLPYVSTLLDTQSLWYNGIVCCMTKSLLYVSSIQEKSSLFTLLATSKSLYIASMSQLSWILSLFTLLVASILETCGRVLMHKKQAQTHGAAATPSLCIVSVQSLYRSLFHMCHSRLCTGRSYVPVSYFIFHLCLFCLSSSPRFVVTVHIG